MDLQMPGMDGVEATRRIVAERAGAEVLVLTSFSDSERIVAALDAGAVGYLLKDAEPDDVLDGDPRRRPRASRRSHPRAARELLRRAAPAPAGTPSSPPREREVLALVRAGPRQQADRPPARHQRAHREGAPDLGVPARSASPTGPRRRCGPSAHGDC